MLALCKKVKGSHSGWPHCSEMPVIGHKTLMPGWHVRHVCLLFVHLTMGSRGAILVSCTWRLDVTHARPACVPAVSATCRGLLHVKTVCRAQRRRLQATCCSCTCAMTAPWDRCVASIRTSECIQHRSCQCLILTCSGCALIPFTSIP